MRGLLEKAKEEKRHMCFVMQQVPDEKIAESFIPVPVNKTYKGKQVCGLGANGNVACDFRKLLQNTHRM